MPTVSMQTVHTATIRIAYQSLGPEAGWPMKLSHGFPYDAQAYGEVAPLLAKAGARVVMPYLRDFGPTRFLSNATMRSGQQATLGNDLINLLDCLGIQPAFLAG